MLKKLIEYTDYNGRERKENFYFSLNKAELMEMELTTTGGMRNLIQLMIDKQDIPKIIKELKKFILNCYGEKSVDGVRFIKSEELSTAFSQTEAYNKLFTELLSDADAAAAFINGVIPEEMRKEIEEDRKEEAKEQESAAPMAETDKEGGIHLLGQK